MSERQPESLDPHRTIEQVGHVPSVFYPATGPKSSIDAELADPFQVHNEEYFGRVILNDVQKKALDEVLVFLHHTPNFITYRVVLIDLACNFLLRRLHFLDSVEENTDVSYPYRCEPSRWREEPIPHSYLVDVAPSLRVLSDGMSSEVKRVARRQFYREVYWRFCDSIFLSSFPPLD